jgi:hypothetical protein
LSLSYRNRTPPAGRISLPGSFRPPVKSSAVPEAADSTPDDPAQKDFGGDGPGAEGGQRVGKNQGKKGVRQKFTCPRGSKNQGDRMRFFNPGP